MSTQQPYIVNYESNEKFHTLIYNLLLEYGNLTPEIITKILQSNNDGISGLALYGQGFTHKSVSDNNYEYYEWIGDQTLNTCICWYFTRRFPQLKQPRAIQVLSKLKTKYISKDIYHPIAEELGFWPFISAGFEQRKSQGQIEEIFVRQNKKKDLLEDSLEAFFGITQTLIDTHIREGIGYKICYNIAKKIYDGLDISLKYEHLVDPITRLKELFDKYHSTKDFDTKYTKNNVVRSFEEETRMWTVSIVISIKGKKMNVSNDSACKAKDAEQMAADKALVYLGKLGYNKDPDTIYSDIRS